MIKEGKIHNNRKIARNRKLQYIQVRTYAHVHVCYCMSDISMLYMCLGMLV